MQMLKNKTMAIVIAIILVTSMAISFGALSTVSATGPHPIPGFPADSYDTATYNAIQAGMYWTNMDLNATAARLVFWNRFQDKVPTHVFIITAPSPIGIGQQCNIVMFNPQVPLNSGGNIVAGYTLRYSYTFTVVKPDGTVQNFPTSTPPSYSSWSMNSVANNVFVSDSTGSTYMTYTPDQVGNYTFTVNFLKIQNLYNSTQGVSNDWYGITLLASNYTTTLTVQQEPVSLSGKTIPPYSPVPTEYWSRPINQENTDWYTIASNWLADAHDYNYGGSQNAYQPDGTAPNSAHILWRYPIEDSGILGGTNEGRLDAANSFNTGSQYQPRLTPPIYGAMGPIIMYGRLYYSPNLYTAGYSELFNCLDLKTGELLYSVNTTAVTGARNLPQFGYYYSQDDINEHGIQNPGWLFASGYTVGYQPQYGYAELHLANAPSWYQIDGSAGENLRYTAVNVGTTASPVYNLLQWNSSKVIPMIASGATPSTLLYEANVPITPSRPSTTSYWNGTAWSTSSNVTALGILSTAAVNPSYDWNITMPTQFNSAATGTITIGGVKLGDILWGYNSSIYSAFGVTSAWPTGTSAPSYNYPDNVTVWAINMALDSNGKPAGSLIYMTTIQVDIQPDNDNILYEHADPNEGVFVGLEVPSQTYYVWDMHTGSLLWKSDAQSDTISPYGYFTWPSLISGSQVKTAYGMLYTGGYSGSVSAYYLSNGTLAWRYEVIPPGTAGVLKSSPGMMAGIADGMVYIGCHEHSAETPLEPGNKVRCLNATTGQLIWQMSGWVYPSTFAVADGVLVYLNNYDESIYAVGQGPTQTTVTAPDVGVTTATPVTIRGTVMDISVGTQQTIVKADFPNGVPTVSEDSMGQWMEYVYMQKAKPTNATGIPVSIDVLDSNGNYRNIGTATSDSSGMFTLTWTPDITGSYTVIATFAGSNGYYGSSAETSFYASSPAPTASPYPTVTLPPTETYFIISTVAIIIAIAIATILLLRKRPVYAVEPRQIK